MSIGKPERGDGTLGRILEECGSLLVAYSGGVDSVFLADVALRVLGAGRVLAVTGVSPSVADRQLRTARRVARERGIPWRELATRETENEAYASNPSDRCYFCKRELYGKLERLAAELGYRTVADGANADDASDHRPGARAAREHGVRSPLQEAGLTKADVRRLSREAGLPTWDAPASPCLASRLPYGVRVTRERLEQVERAEEALRALGVEGDLRVRHHAGVARIELPPDDLSAWADGELRARAVERLRALGFRRVLLDLEGYRTGSLNRVLGPTEEPASDSRSTPREADSRWGKAGSPSPGGRPRSREPRFPTAEPRPESPGPGTGGPPPGEMEGEVVPGIREYGTVVGSVRVLRAGPDAVAGLLGEDRRGSLVARARREGFAHLALELEAPGRDPGRGG